MIVRHARFSLAHPRRDHARPTAYRVIFGKHANATNRLVRTFGGGDRDHNGETDDVPACRVDSFGQLVINTGTTIVTFLMVFLIQATQNRDTLALQLKLDELIIATKNARNEVAGIEEAADHILEAAKLEMKGRASPAAPPRPPNKRA